jgi:hypothetical protein
LIDFKNLKHEEYSKRMAVSVSVSLTQGRGDKFQF